MRHRFPDFRISRRTAILLVLLISALLVLNAALIIQNRNLRASEAASRSFVLREGVLVPSRRGVDVDGNEFSLDFGSDARKVLILVFSPRCGYCEKNMPNWSALVSGLDPKSFRIVAVSTTSDGVKDYLAKYSFAGVPVLSEVDPKTKVSYQMNVTPETIVIDSHGRVERIWTGVLQRDELREVSQFLNVKLVT